MLLNGEIESTALVSQLCFKVPQRVFRNTALFYVPRATANYLANEPLKRLMSNANVDPNFNF